MDSMFSAIVRIGLIITLVSIINMLSLVFKPQEHKLVRWLAAISVLLILFTGIVFVVVLLP